jgi:RNA polymerase sigma factor (sigma-70 family)
VATSQMSEVIDHLRRAVLAGGEADLTDGQLLDCFVRRRDEAAVAALVRRHGPMVWGVCRRVLRSHQDAEDAFQATFLVLVRKAASILPREMVANWLYGVAHQTALKARATTTRRQAREKQVHEMPEPEARTEPDLWHDLQPVLDQELSRLPDKYRIALVLCDLEGKTRKEVAGQLKIPEGTLSSRLTTARRMLAKRLARHGLAVSGGALAVVLAQKSALACVPTSVVSSTIKAASLLAAGEAAAGMISVKVAALTQGVLKTMFVTKLKTATVLLLAVSLVGLSTTVITYRTLASEQGRATNDAAPTTPARDGDKEAKGSEKPATRSITTVDTQEPFAGEPKAEGKDRERKEEPLEGRTGSSPKLQALLKARLETLREMAEAAKQLYKENAASQGVVRQANLRVYKAELDMAETAKDRIAVLEKIADVYKDEEESVSQLVKRGMAAQGVVREARISRLEAEIALEREKAKLGPPAK